MQYRFRKQYSVCVCVQGSVSVDSLKQEAVSLKFSHDELSLEKSPCSLNDIEICLTTAAVSKLQAISPKIYRET